MQLFHSLPSEAACAIGSYENADGNSFASYEPHPPFGFLGVLEAEIETCVLLKPLAIWHQSVQPND